MEIASRSASLRYEPRTTGTKVCSGCGVEKPVSEFSANRCNKRDGLQTKCKACQAARYAVYYTDNRNVLIDRVKLWYNEHRNDKAQYNATYRADHRAESAQWRRDHLEDRRADEQRRRAVIAAVGGTHTAADVQRQGEAQHWMCWWRLPGCTGYCKDKYEVDHVFPVSRGGHNSPGNLVISCPNCNRRKGNKTPDELCGRLF